MTLSPPASQGRTYSQWGCALSSDPDLPQFSVAAPPGSLGRWLPKSELPAPLGRSVAALWCSTKAENYIPLARCGCGSSALQNLPRAYESLLRPSAVGAARVDQERTKGESRGLLARCMRTIAAAAAVGVLLSPLWKGSVVAYRAARYHLPHSGLGACRCCRRRQRRARAHQRRIEGSIRPLCAQNSRGCRRGRAAVAPLASFCCLQSCTCL